MIKLGRSTTILYLIFGVLVLAATSSAQTLPPIAEQTAKAYGLDAFGQVEAIRFTFNADLPGGVKSSRTWEWHPKTDTVSYEAKDKEGKPVKAAYQRSQLGSQSDAVKNDIDPSFINDQYWLLLPLHLVWDGGATMTADGMQKLPLGNASAERVVMKYPSEGRYAPADTWEFYVGASHHLTPLPYPPARPPTPTFSLSTF